MTLFDPLFSALLLAFRFSLDYYSDWYGSPSAAQVFWSFFFAVLLLIVVITLWVVRRTRPH